MTCILLLIISFGVYAMSINDIGKQCLFSSFSGVITLNGKPVDGAKIKRIAYRSHTKGNKTDYTITNEQGEFFMPTVWDRNIVGKFLPMEFAAAQEVFVYVDNQEYQIWYGVKREREENSEMRGNKLNVQCELLSEDKTVWVNGSPVSFKLVVTKSKNYGSILSGFSATSLINFQLRVAPDQRNGFFAFACS